MTPVLVAESVSKRFAARLPLSARMLARSGKVAQLSAVRAVDNVTLEIGAGEAVGLVGESGCGKSTLGRMLAGIHRPTDGQVLYRGRPVVTAAGRPLKLTTKIQMIFQDPLASLDPRMRVGDQVAEGPLVHRLVQRREAREYVATWLGLVGLPADAINRFPHQFSGGQRQRIAIARALAMQPEVLICDEPVASLDVSVQAQVINLLLRLRRELGLTVLFISHDLAVVRHLCDRIAVMYLGRVVETGPTQAIYESPWHPYTRALLDSTPRLVTERRGSLSFRPIVGEVPSAVAPPTGCHFHPRCAFATAECRRDAPSLTSIGPRAVACHHPLR